ncbi:MAG: GH36-type glycosyl hydrolase domain-containing protein [Fibrobacterota bacterium]
MPEQAKYYFPYISNGYSCFHGKSEENMPPFSSEDLDNAAEKFRKYLKSGGKGPLPLDKTIDALRNRYAEILDSKDNEGFISGGSCFVKTPDTPRPFLHIIASSHSREKGCLGSFWDQSGMGFTCLDSVMAGAVTSHKDKSYVPTSPENTDRRLFIVREDNKNGRYKSESGKSYDAFHLIPQPGRDADDYDDFRCEQGLDTINYFSAFKGLECSMMVFVTREDSAEIISIRIRNKTRKKRTLTVFSKINWDLSSYPSHYFDPRVVSEGKYNKKAKGLFAVNNDQKNKFPRIGFFLSGAIPDSYDMMEEVFEGGGYCRYFPKAVEEGRCGDSEGRQPYKGLIGAFSHRLEIESGAEKRIDLLLGALNTADINKAEKYALDLRRKYMVKGAAEKELKAIMSGWEKRISLMQIDTPDPEINRFFNVWSKYQARNTSRFTRALDMVGYRDLMQDLLGISDFDTEYMKKMLSWAMEYQLKDGRAVRQFSRFKGVTPDMRMYMDSSVWLVESVYSYLCETGDFDFLDQKLGYFDPDLEEVKNDADFTVLEHMLRAVKSLYDYRQQFGLCRIGHGDWNDAIDSVGKSPRGVSAWLSMALVYAAKMLRKITRLRDDRRKTGILNEIIDTMSYNVNAYAFLDKHYVYAFADRAEPIGSNSCREGKLHLNSNAWAVFSGISGLAGHTDDVLKAMEKLNTPLGYKLLHPCYSDKSRDVGRIADMVPGMFENGSIYTHGQSFAAYAFAYLGMGKKAYDAIKKSLPSSNIPDISTTAPHQLANFYVGPDHPDFGKALYSNFTGSLAWFRKTIARMSGVYPVLDGLRIDPVIPSEWKKYRVRKKWRGAEFNFTFHNPDGVERGVISVKCRGKDLPIDENGYFMIPDGMFKTGKIPVEVKMGPDPTGKKRRKK